MANDTAINSVKSVEMNEKSQKPKRLQPELAFIKGDLEIADKFGDLAVDAFGVSPLFIKQKPPTWTDLLLIAQAKRSKSRFKPIFVPHKDDIDRGIFPAYHIIKGSGETFMTVLQKGQKSPKAKTASIKVRPMSAAAVSTNMRTEPSKQRPKSAISRFNLDSVLDTPIDVRPQKRRKYKSDGSFGGLRMSLVPTRGFNTLYGDKKDEDYTISDSESATTDSEALGYKEDKLTDFSKLIDRIHAKGAKNKQQKYSYREEKSVHENKKYQGAKTMHLAKHQKDEKSMKEKTSITMDYLLSSRKYNSSRMLQDSVRTEVLRNQPRRRQILTKEHRLKQLREKHDRVHFTTYYNGRDWLRAKEKEEEKTRAKKEAERKNVIKVIIEQNKTKRDTADKQQSQEQL